MKTAINKALLFAHFEGRTTPLQIELLREWLQEADNQQLYYGWLQEWEQQNPQIISDPDVAYLKFQQQTAGTSQAAATPRMPVWKQWRIQSFFMAASVTALVLTVAYMTRNYWAMRTIATDYGEVRSVVLPDGSCVTLNANSELRLSRFSFGTLSPSREVFLKGEAEFAVVHTPTHDHFRVHTTNDVEVVVLGTEFVVNTRRNNTRVELNRGKVQLRYPAPDQISTLTMRPGDWVNLSAGGQAKRGRVDTRQQPATTWKNYEYNFQRTPMPEIANLLADNFGLTVQLDSALARRKVTGTFHAHNADELVQALVELFDIDVIRDGKTIQLSVPKSGPIQ
ncbi:FecR family protein [Spirosoma validum]|uniref:FecR domain-containing protein n=1 Tax=Spirosoma validum TaxID=2771355 RepID=A0A927GB98_9BACT|nr:FecR domain-containing protein [Spirosoma validum]MBD2751270.1 FecR domain-containing protein [Spirosoma validum]